MYFTMRSLDQMLVLGFCLLSVVDLSGCMTQICQVSGFPVLLGPKSCWLAFYLVSVLGPRMLPFPGALWFVIYTTSRKKRRKVASKSSQRLFYLIQARIYPLIPGELIIGGLSVRYRDDRPILLLITHRWHRGINTTSSNQVY